MQRFEERDDYISKQLGRCTVDKIHIDFFDKTCVVAYAHIFDQTAVIDNDYLRAYYENEWLFLKDALILKVVGRLSTTKSKLLKDTPADETLRYAVVLSAFEKNFHCWHDELDLYQQLNKGSVSNLNAIVEFFEQRGLGPEPCFEGLPDVVAVDDSDLGHFAKFLNRHPKQHEMFSKSSLLVAFKKICMLKARTPKPVASPSMKTEFEQYLKICRAIAAINISNNVIIKFIKWQTPNLRTINDAAQLQASVLVLDRAKWPAILKLIELAV